MSEEDFIGYPPPRVIQEVIHGCIAATDYFLFDRQFKQTAPLGNFSASTGKLFEIKNI